MEHINLYVEFQIERNLGSYTIAADSSVNGNEKQVNTFS